MNQKFYKYIAIAAVILLAYMAFKPQVNNVFRRTFKAGPAPGKSSPTPEMTEEVGAAGGVDLEEVQYMN